MFEIVQSLGEWYPHYENQVPVNFVTTSCFKVTKEKEEVAGSVRFYGVLTSPLNGVLANQVRVIPEYIF